MNIIKRIVIKTGANRRLPYFISQILKFLPIVWLIALLTSFAEIYFYPGVILKHTLIDSVLIYLAFGILGILRLFSPERKIRSLHTFNKINYYGIYLFGLVYIFFYVSAKTHYPNYVFSTYHIHPTQTAVPLVLSLYSYMISSKDVFRVIHKSPEILFKWFPTVIILLWIFFQNFIDSGAYAMREILFIVENPTASYDRKMEEKVGKQFYNYVMFVKNNTPENSTILLPPFPTWPWAQTGNVPYMTYFLYPRKLLNGKEFFSSYDLKKDNIDYVLIVWGELPPPPGSYGGWPKFDVNAEKIVYMISPTEKKEEKGDYVYKQSSKTDAWGIIKVRK